MRCRWWAQLRVRLLVSFAFIVWGTILYTHHTMQRVLDHDLPLVELQALSHRAEQLRAALETTYAAQGQLRSPLLDHPALVPLHMYDAQGTLVGSTSALPAQPHLVQQALAAQPVEARVLVDAQGAQHAYQVFPLQHDAQVVGAVELYGELAPVAQFRAAARHQLLVAGLIAFCAISGVGLYLSGNLNRLLREIKAQTQSIVRGNFERRIAVRSDDELGQIAADLNYMAQELGQLATERTEFLGKVAHELRTPLTIMRGFVSMLTLNNDAPAHTRTLAVIDQQLDDLTRLVNDLLELARRNRGTLDLQPEPLDAAALLHDVAEQHRVLLPQLHFEVQVRAPATIYADRQRLQQVLANLVANAGRHARQQVSLTLDADRDQVAVQVRDDGSGIAPGDLRRIFEPFFQAAGGARGRAGLGLTICREVVLAHHGTLDVASVPGRSTTFTVRLPQPPAHAACGADRPAGLHERRDVRYVEA